MGMPAWLQAGGAFGMGWAVALRQVGRQQTSHTGHCVEMGLGPVARVIQPGGLAGLYDFGSEQVV